jgi:hypothetical protein
MYKKLPEVFWAMKLNSSIRLHHLQEKKSVLFIDVFLVMIIDIYNVLHTCNMSYIHPWYGRWKMQGMCI